MSTHQNLPATNSMSLAEARELGLLDQWRCRRAQNNNIKGFKNRHKRTSPTHGHHLADSAKPRLAQGEIRSLNIPWAPSVNGYWERSQDGGMHIGRAGKRYIKRIADLVLVNRWGGLIGDALCEVALVLYPPDKNVPYDADNYNKAILDSLTKSGVWVDDDQVKRLHIVMGAPVKSGAVEIAVRLHVPVVLCAADLLRDVLMATGGADVT
jgi:crossover junction endodeoxyribonuclease RusA